jgi:GNAT superfamily N-acetyltransferase
MSEKLLNLMQEHMNLSEKNRIEWLKRIETQDCFIPIFDDGNPIGGISYEFWTYNENIPSCYVLLGTEHHPQALERCKEALQSFIKSHPQIQMFSSRVVSTRQDILESLNTLGFSSWYDYMTMLDYEPIDVKSDVKLHVRNIEPDDFEMVFQHMGACFVSMRESVDIRPFNVVEKLWATPEKKQASYDEWIAEKENTFVYFDQDEFIGSGLLISDYDIDDVFVVIKHQGKGYGKAIIMDLIEKVKARGKTPTIGYVGVNQRAGLLYQSCGFKLTHHSHYIRMFTRR